MTYIEGFVCAVPPANKAAYREHATQASAVLRELGVQRIVEAWADDVPDGKLTDFRRAVRAGPEEAVLFSWAEWPSKAAREAGFGSFLAERAMNHARMPFDARRMIFGGFVPILVA